MKKRRTNASIEQEPRFMKLSRDRRLILIDQEPLRKEAGRAARKKIAEMEKLESSLEEFDKTILPAYARWEDKILGPLLSEERQIHAKIARLEYLIQEASFEAMFTSRCPEEIFTELEEEMNEREEQDTQHRSGPRPPETDTPLDPDKGGDFSEEEREFRSYVRYSVGEEPDAFSKHEYQRLFREFRRWNQRREEEVAGIARKKSDIPTRVKELYRVLVRRLHPDSAKNRTDSQTKRLWHDLQDAYAAMDVDRLETLLVISDLYEGGSDIRSTLFHLRKVTKEMDRSVKVLRSRLREIKCSHAWTFWHSKDREKTGQILRTAVESRIRDAKKHIEFLESEIDLWKKSGNRRNRSRAQTLGGKSKQARSKASEEFLDQGFFDF